MRQRRNGWSVVTGTEQVRQHIKALQAQGMSYQAIADRAGVHKTSVYEIATGQNRCFKITGEAILGVKLRLPPHAVVPGIGAVRRLQALACAGFGARMIAKMLGESATMVGRWRCGFRVGIQYRHHRQVDDLYQRLINGAEPRLTPGMRATATKAISRGWQPVEAWDDQTIDDPDATAYSHLERDTYVDWEKVNRVKRRQVVDGVRYQFTDLSWPEQLHLFHEFVQAGGSPRTFRDRYRPVPAAILRALEETIGEDLRLVG